MITNNTFCLRNIVRILVLLFTVYYKETVAFVPVSLVVPSRISPIQWTKVIDQPSQQRRRYKYHSFSTVTLLASSEDDELELSESSQSILGAAGTLASLIVFYSEFTLKTTGCGLPAGPFGLFGLAEGLSYLGVTGLVAYSLVTKVKTGSGLPAGPGGLLGAAEGLSYLAIVVGLVVLVLQVTTYGYIPNAVPMEGGMCN